MLVAHEEGSGGAPAVEADGRGFEEKADGVKRYDGCD
jgi:hypothetical protein